MTLSPALFFAAGTAGGSALVSAASYFESPRQLSVVFAANLYGTPSSEGISSTEETVTAAFELLGGLGDHLERGGTYASQAAELRQLVDGISGKVMPLNPPFQIGQLEPANEEIEVLLVLLSDLPPDSLSGWEVNSQGIARLIGRDLKPIEIHIPELPHPPLEGWLGRFSVSDRWIQTEVQRLLEANAPYSALVAAGMFIRLRDIGAEEVAADRPYFDALKKGEMATEPQSIGFHLDWVRGWTPEEREAVYQYTRSASMLILEELDKIEDGIDSDKGISEEVLAEEMLYLFHLREDLQGLLLLLQHGEHHEEVGKVGRFVTQIDQRGRDLVRCLDEEGAWFEGWLGDERLIRASTVDVDGWWVSPAYSLESEEVEPRQVQITITPPPVAELGQIVSDDPWLAREIAQRRLAEPNVYQQIAIAGMVLRLFELEDARDSMARKIPLVQGIQNWARGLGAEERERIARAAEEEARAIGEELERLWGDEAGDNFRPADADWQEALARLLRRREDLEGVLSFVAPIADELPASTRALIQQVDLRGRDFIDALPVFVGFLDDEEWLRRASMVSPDGWWTDLPTEGQEVP